MNLRVTPAFKQGVIAYARARGLSLTAAAQELYAQGARVSDQRRLVRCWGGHSAVLYLSDSVVREGEWEAAAARGLMTRSEVIRARLVVGLALYAAEGIVSLMSLIKKVGGSDPDFTGEMTTEESRRSIRGDERTTPPDRTGPQEDPRR